MQTIQPEIRLFSGISVVTGNEVIEKLPNQRLAALVANLALRPGWLNRAVVAEEIWPDLPEGNALASLRNALSALRRILGPVTIESTRTHVRLNRSSCTCDAWLFTSALEKKDFLGAIHAYRGDLAPDLTDDWISTYRHQYQSEFLLALARQAKSALDTLDFEIARRLATRWLEADPFDIHALRALALAEASMGHAQIAVRELEEFCQRYRSEFGDDPDLDREALRIEIRIREKNSVQIHSEPPATPKTSAKLTRQPAQPLYLTRFFGREAELSAVLAWSSGPDRLMTVMGSGGMGKTRLSVESLAKLSEMGMDALFVPLAGVDDRNGILAAILSGFEVRETVSDHPLDSILPHLADTTSPIIFILDNLEHILAPATEVVIELLALHKNVKCLCTSRGLLGLEGERLIALNALSVPSEEESPEQMLGHPTLQMFLDRARNSRADFALSARNSQDVAALCRDLEGLPLAIEIMAAWSGTWSLAEMRKRVRDNQILARKKGHDSRHHSLEACIEWSYRLQSPRSQSVLRKLSLFRGPWTIEAASLLLDEAAESDLALLVDRSLINSQESEAGLEFAMLESVRSFAQALLTPQELADVAPRFAIYYKELASRLVHIYPGVPVHLHHRQLDRERDNIEAAFRLCLSGLADIEDGLLLSGSMRLHWVYRGQYQFGIDAAEALLKAAGHKSASLGRFMALQSLSVLALELGDTQRVEETVIALQQLADQLDDPAAKFMALTQAGNVVIKKGTYQSAVEIHLKASEIAHQMESPRCLAVAYTNLGEAYFGLNQLEEAGSCWDQGIIFDSILGTPAGDATMNSAFLDVLCGRLEAAKSKLLKVLAELSQVGFSRGFARMIQYIALWSAKRGEVTSAVSLMHTADRILSSQRAIMGKLEQKFSNLAIQGLAEIAATTLDKDQKSVWTDEKANQIAIQLLTA